MRFLLRVAFAASVVAHVAIILLAKHWLADSPLTLGIPPKKTTAHQVVRKVDTTIRVSLSAPSTLRRRSTARRISTTRKKETLALTGRPTKERTRRRRYGDSDITQVPSSQLTPLPFSGNAPDAIGLFAPAPGEKPAAHSFHAEERYVAALTRGENGSLKFDDSVFEATIGADGSITLADKPTGDLTDVIMRMRGDDPYVARKQKFLNATRQFRQQIKRKHNKQNLNYQVQRLPHHLKSLWRKRGVSLARKRQLLFYLWDDCDDTETSQAAFDAATKAREHVLNFIRIHLPAGSTSAFTKAELKQFNAIRQSRERFTPYATSK